MSQDHPSKPTSETSTTAKPTIEAPKLGEAMPEWHRFLCLRCDVERMFKLNLHGVLKQAYKDREFDIPCPVYVCPVCDYITISLHQADILRQRTHAAWEHSEA